MVVVVSVCSDVEWGSFVDACGSADGITSSPVCDDTFPSSLLVCGLLTSCRNRVTS